MSPGTTGLEPDSGALPLLRIDSIGAGGVGVGRDDQGRVIFVPRTAPGDLARIQLEQERARWAKARLVALVEPGPDRRTPPCPLYDRCGGCALQHMDGRAQRAAKRRIVEDALRRIGNIDLDVPEVAREGEELGYRNRLAVTLRRQEEGVIAGFRDLWRPDELVDAPDCPLGEPAVRRALMELRSVWGDRAERLPAGDELRITIRAASDGSVALHVDGGEPGRCGEPVPVQAGICNLVSYAWTDARAATTTLAGSDHYMDTWQGVDFDLGPGSFLQVNRAASAAMDAFLDACVGPRAGLRVADLYAGVGARALRWAREGADVTAVEVDRRACASARAAAAREGLDVRILAVPVERAASRFAKVDVAIVNPPRAGLAASVADSLSQRGPRSGLGYVSCDPATLARDLRRLAPTWAPSRIRVFDAFPQTAHVETVVWLERRGGSPGADGVGA